MAGFHHRTSRLMAKFSFLALSLPVEGKARFDCAFAFRSAPTRLTPVHYLARFRSFEEKKTPLAEGGELALSHLRQNLACLGRRVGRFRDRPPHHDVACSGLNRLVRGDDPSLVVLSRSRGTYTRRHDQKIVS